MVTIDLEGNAGITGAIPGLTAIQNVSTQPGDSTPCSKTALIQVHRKICFVILRYVYIIEFINRIEEIKQNARLCRTHIIIMYSILSQNATKYTA